MISVNSLPTYRRALLSERLEQAICVSAFYIMKFGNFAQICLLPKRVKNSYDWGLIFIITLLTLPSGSKNPNA